MPEDEFYKQFHNPPGFSGPIGDETRQKKRWEGKDQRRKKRATQRKKDKVRFKNELEKSATNKTGSGMAGKAAYELQLNRAHNRHVMEGGNLSRAQFKEKFDSGDL